MIARRVRAAATACLCLLATPLVAADRKPYEPAEARFERVQEVEPDLAALIERLRAAVAHMDVKAVDAELSPEYRSRDCFLDPTRACVARGAGAKEKAYLARKPAQRLREDLCCRDIAPGKITPRLREETALGLIGAALEEETLGVSPFEPTQICAPAPPHFDRAAAARIAAAADIEKEDLRLAAAELIAREKPAKDAEVIGRVGAGRIAPLVTEADQALPDGWSALALPDGRVAYTDSLGLNELTYAGVCFGRASGVWRLVSVIDRKP
jgi:hypothetical protein